MISLLIWIRLVKAFIPGLPRYIGVSSPRTKAFIPGLPGYICVLCPLILVCLLILFTISIDILSFCIIYFFYWQEFAFCGKNIEHRYPLYQKTLKKQADFKHQHLWSPNLVKQPMPPQESQQAIVKRGGPSWSTNTVGRVVIVARILQATTRYAIYAPFGEFNARNTRVAAKFAELVFWQAQSVAFA